jgi:hypothetical protein
MGFRARSLLVAALALTPSAAVAQANLGRSPAPPSAGGAASSGAAEPGGADAPAGEGGERRGPAGYAYRDKPQKRSAGRAVKRAGPVATMPGFQPTASGGSRLFVMLSEEVSVEERQAKGTLTYILKGAHVARRNNTNALVTVHFNTPVSRARLVPKGKDLHFVVDLRAAVTPTWRTEKAEGGSVVLIEFAPGEYVSGGGAGASPGRAPAAERPRAPASPGGGAGPNP